jgi:hypothetical protein
MASYPTIVFLYIHFHDNLKSHIPTTVWNPKLVRIKRILTTGEKRYTGYTQKNGAVSKVNEKFISHLTRAQRTPSAAVTVQVSHALPAVRFSCLLLGRGASFQDGVAAGEGVLCAPV